MRCYSIKYADSFSKKTLSLRESNNPKGLDKRSNERHSDGVIANHPVT